MPSDHMWGNLLLPALPQFLNQEPPRPQQLALPDLPMVPHLRHTNLLVVVVIDVAVRVIFVKIIEYNKSLRKSTQQS